MSTRNEQKDFIAAVDKLYARVYRLRDVADDDNWDRDLWVAYQDTVGAIKCLTKAYEALP